jgi:TPP-dependent pyruvate/acetoin dehydrogenase alpha subunit
MSSSATVTDQALATLEPDHATDLYRRMVLIREFDTLVTLLVKRGRIRGTAHSALGQEAVAVGTCAALRTDDRITSTHRGHGHAIAKGVAVEPMMAELFGRATGSCHGKGGSMHIADFSVGMLGANGVVGGGFGIATGAALGLRLQGSDAVAVCFFGDSAVNQGAFLENGNYAALHRLPVVYVCEDNGFAMSMPSSRATALDRLADRSAAFGFPGESVDGMDVVATRAAVAGAVERARRGDGPTLIVASCYRFDGHHIGDAEDYRTAADGDPWRERDPIATFRARLAAAGILAESRADAIVTEARARVAGAVEAAEADPLPEIADAWSDISA